MSELPEGWAHATLGALTRHTLGGDWGTGPDNCEPNALPVGVIRGTEFRSWSHDRAATAATRFIKQRSLEKRQLVENDLVVEISGGGPHQPVGRVLRVDQAALRSFGRPLICSNFCRQLRLHDPLQSAFVELALKRLYSIGELEAIQTSSTNLRNLDFNAFLNLDVPIAPLAEQRRIVEKVEALLEQVTRAKERLEQVQLILERFRQAVLAAACSGELSGEEGNVEGPYDFLPLLPSGWSWVTAEQACQRVVDCHNKTAPYASAGIRLLRTTNIRNGKLILDDARYVTMETYSFWSRRCPPEPGDVLFTREAPMGEAALIPPGMVVCMGQRMMLLRPDANIISAEFLLLAIQGPHVMKYAEHVAVGSGVLHMRVGDVERLPIPLPPVAVQQSIVENANRLLDLAERIAQRTDAARTLSENLPQAILSRAFSGGLVPTEAELARAQGRAYETAEELLARCRASSTRAPLSGTKRARKRRSTSMQEREEPRGRNPPPVGEVRARGRSWAR